MIELPDDCFMIVLSQLNDTKDKKSIRLVNKRLKSLIESTSPIFIKFTCNQSASIEWFNKSSYDSPIDIQNRRLLVIGASLHQNETRDRCNLRIGAMFCNDGSRIKESIIHYTTDEWRTTNRAMINLFGMSFGRMVAFLDISLNGIEMNQMNHRLLFCISIHTTPFIGAQDPLINPLTQIWDNNEGWNYQMVYDYRMFCYNCFKRTNSWTRFDAVCNDCQISHNNCNNLAHKLKTSTETFGPIFCRRFHFESN